MFANKRTLNADDTERKYICASSQNQSGQICVGLTGKYHLLEKNHFSTVWNRFKLICITVTILFIYILSDSWDIDMFALIFSLKISKTDPEWKNIF